MSYSPKILIVDDEPGMCRSLKILLGHSGYEAETRHSGREALECLVENDFDIVLLDMRLPDMSGVQIMDHIQSQLPQTFVIVITGHASLDSSVESLKKGAFDYLKKPFEHQELMITVENALRQKRLAQDRKKAEEGLRQAHDELERRVEERTGELAESNEKLKQEIRERRRAEEELRNMNKELESILHIVSHDLKNPIISIQGFSARLTKKYQSELEGKGKTYLQHIMSNARRMEVLVSDLVALLRLGRMVSDFQDVSSQKMVNRVTSSLQDRLRQNSVELAVADNLPDIHCDAERIYQVFENLFVNAIRFSGTSEPPRIEVGYKDKGRFHQFHVKDNGIGIDPKYHQKIFDMFQRLREIDNDEGTGIGLAIVKRIVTGHGGKAWTESEKDKGATFFFTLPKAQS